MPGRGSYERVVKDLLEGDRVNTQAGAQWQALASVSAAPEWTAATNCANPFQVHRHMPVAKDRFWQAKPSTSLVLSPENPRTPIAPFSPSLYSKIYVYMYKFQFRPLAPCNLCLRLTAEYLAWGVTRTWGYHH
jgi:hypothetical protein